MKRLTAECNDPCPCGSGKKYKNCCLEKDASAASEQSATGATESLRQALGDRQFNSMEEVQAFVERHTQQINQGALEEFHGLSPEQMHRLLNFPFTSPQLVRFPETLGIGPKTLILSLFDLLVGAIGEQGLKPTAKGNLPQKFCREAALIYWGEERYRENTRFGGINREDDFADLHVTRLVAELAGLVRKYRGRFILSRNCRTLLTRDGLASIYPLLFRAFVEQYNWGYRDHYPELRFIQQAFLFTLYLLTQYGDSWLPDTFYADNFLRAFPSVLNEVPPRPVFSPEEEIRNCYTWRSLVHFAGFLGLAEVEPISEERFSRQYRVKALPLLNEAVQFQLSR